MSKSRRCCSRRRPRCPRAFMRFTGWQSTNGTARKHCNSRSNTGKVPVNNAQKIAGADTTSCIIALFSPDLAADTAMEAEQLNAINRRLTDLSQRNAELRRYL